MTLDNPLIIVTIPGAEPRYCNIVALRHTAPDAATLIFESRDSLPLGEFEAEYVTASVSTHGTLNIQEYDAIPSAQSQMSGIFTSLALEMKKARPRPNRVSHAAFPYLL